MPPKQTKPKTDANVAAPAPAPVVESKKPVSDAATKAPKVKKEPKTKTETVNAEPVKAAVVEKPVVEKAVVEKASAEKASEGEAVEGDVSDITAQSAEFLAKLSQMSNLFTALKTEFRALEKKWTREMKAAQKSQAKRKRKTGNRQPSGFVKPTLISDELATFLSKEKGSMMARTDVTREITEYVRVHKLQDPSNGRRILFDDKLKRLLGLKDTDELTYFNLQRFMSHHFPKTVKPVATA
jgi:chromatin remodeling complex protein RSC6